jgi:hypothetical protein
VESVVSQPAEARARITVAIQPNRVNLGVDKTMSFSSIVGLFPQWDTLESTQAASRRYLTKIYRDAEW